jgi:hypothetical protein
MKNTLNNNPITLSNKLFKYLVCIATKAKFNVSKGGFSFLFPFYLADDPLGS